MRLPGEKADGQFTGPVQAKELGQGMGLERAEGWGTSRCEWKCHHVKQREPEVQEFC